MPDSMNDTVHASARTSQVPADASRRPPIPMDDLLSLPICPHLGSTFGAFAPKRPSKACPGVVA